MVTSGGVRPENLRAEEAGAGGVGAGFPRPYTGPPPGRGCALPNPPAGGGTGKPGFPVPLPQQLIFTLAIHAAPPHTNGMKIISREGCALPNPPAGGGMGKPGFPVPLLEGQTLPRAGA